MSNLKITVWNVERGTSIYVVAPNGKKVFLDCGSSSEFSPALEVNPDYETKKLDYLVISHPHQDHITDLQNIDDKFNIKVLSRNKKISKDVMTEDNPDVFDPPNDVIIGKYFELPERFTHDVEWENNPSNPTWGNGCTFHTFTNDDISLGVNNLSVVTFIEFGDETILYGGDMEEKGWLEMLKKENFRHHLKKTTILIASHHGNDSGYCNELFDYFTPKITIFSAGSYVDDNARNKYENHTKGMTVRNQSGYEENRLVLTTRNDGHIQIVVYPLGIQEPKISLHSNQVSLVH
jgi:competence protein ComEC